MPQSSSDTRQISVPLTLAVSPALDEDALAAAHDAWLDDDLSDTEDIVATVVRTYLAALIDRQAEDGS